ncbi:unnamed protein product [Meganyctiphanes norvegica]|uniref:UDP-glucuronosyltransferase n=1 Tax=Meganyctiphanes norvegica TaxID=48144 RepID=A0AAV2PX98_MEGNR
MRGLLISYTLSLLFIYGHASRILVLGPVAFKSHANFYMDIAKALTDHKHEVTIVLPYRHGAPSNITEIVLPVGEMSTKLPDLFKYGTTGFFKFCGEHCMPLCFEGLLSDEFKSIDLDDFDILLMSSWMSECFYGALDKINIPYILVQPFGLEFDYISRDLGNPFFRSFNPHIFLGYSPSGDDGLPFTQRLLGSLLGQFFTLANWNNFRPNGEMTKLWQQRGLCDDDCPDFYGVRLNASMIIINSIRTSENVANPYGPTVVHAGGIHLKPAKTLSQDLKEWIMNSGDSGFILFSLGSVVKASNMPEESRRLLLSVLGSLPHRVLWKWDQDTMENLPDNVHLSKWLPQQDLLGDARVRLFITHGGLHSTQEAMFNAVPVVGLPVFSDQYMNMAAVESQGWGRTLDWNNLTEENIYEAITDVINNDKYKLEATRRSRVIRDQFLAPQDIVNYWVEYVIRHKGAQHLQSPVKHMPWYKLYNVDVWTSIILCFALVIYICMLLLKSLLRCIIRRTKLKKK